MIVVCVIAEEFLQVMWLILVFLVEFQLLLSTL